MEKNSREERGKTENRGCVIGSAKVKEVKWSARGDKRNWLEERAAAEEKAAEKEGEGRMCERQGSAQDRITRKIAELVSSRFWRKTKRRMEKDELDEDNSSREVDDFIAAQRSSNTVKKTKYEWKKFDRFCEQQVDGYFNVMNIPAAALDNLLNNFDRQYFKLPNKNTRVILLLFVFLYLPFVFLQKPYKVDSAPKRCHILLSFRQQILLIELSSISFSLFNCL